MAYVLPGLDVPQEVVGKDVFEIASTESQLDNFFTWPLDTVIDRKQTQVLNYLRGYETYFTEQENELFAILGQGRTAKGLAQSIIDRIDFGKAGDSELAKLIKDAIIELQKAKAENRLQALLEKSYTGALKDLQTKLKGKRNSLNSALKKFFNSGDSVKKEAGFLLEALLSVGEKFIKPGNKKQEQQVWEGISMRVATSKKAQAVLGSDSLVGATDIILGIKSGEQIVKIPISLKLKTDTIRDADGRLIETWTIGNDFSGSSMSNFFTKENAGVNISPTTLDYIEWYALNIGQIYKEGWSNSNITAIKETIEQLSFLNGLAFIILGDHWKNMMGQVKRKLNTLKESDASTDSYPPLLIGSASEMVTTAQVLRFIIDFVSKGLFKTNAERKSQFGFYMTNKWAKGAKGIPNIQAIEHQDFMLANKDQLTRRAHAKTLSWVGLEDPADKLNEGTIFHDYVRQLAKDNGTTQQMILLALLEGRHNILAESGNAVRTFVPRPHIADYVSVNYHIAISNIMALQTNK